MICAIACLGDITSGTVLCIGSRLSLRRSAFSGNSNSTHFG